MARHYEELYSGGFRNHFIPPKLRSKVPLIFPQSMLQIVHPKQYLRILDSKDNPLRGLDVIIGCPHTKQVCFLTDEQGFITITEALKSHTIAIYLDFGRIKRTVTFDPLDRGRQLRATLRLSPEEVEILGL